MKKPKAPYTDFANNVLHLGDKIQHPDGNVATVMFDADREHNFWRAVYQDGQSLALGLQVGDRGRAVRIDVAAGAMPEQWAEWLRQYDEREERLARGDMEYLAAKNADPFQQRKADRAANI